MNTEYRVVRPMKYSIARNSAVLADALASPDYGIQLKTDGSSYVLAKDLDGTIHLYGDRISKKTGTVIDKIENVPHLRNWAEDFFPVGSQLCVEILCRWDYTANKAAPYSSKLTNSIMLCLPEKAVQRQREHGVCEVYVFDILWWDNEAWFPKDFADRDAKLDEIFNSKEYPGFVHKAATFYENKDGMLRMWLNSGEEGGVLKLLHSKGRTSAAHQIAELNQTAKRPANTTFKVKQYDTFDAIIMGIEMPTKEYTGKDPDGYQYRDDEGNPVNRLWKLGLANAIRVGAKTNIGEVVEIGTVASGLDDAIRRRLVNNFEEFDGVVVELGCMSVGENHKLRHPRFLCLRPDKSPDDCLLSEIK